MSGRPVLVLHGGAASRRLQGSRLQAFVQSQRKILATVYPELKRGMSAVEAACLAASLLEDDPLYNAGKGSKIQSDGVIRMSASLMDGAQRRFGGCVNVERLKNPIFLAKALMKTKDRVLSGKGAQAFAREIGLEMGNPYTLEQRQAYLSRKKGKTGTIGALALDRGGRLAAATSTGGKGFEYPCRVSDSPTVAGNFANSVCAVSATGTGEEIVESAAAATICAWREAGQSLEISVARLLREARKRKAQFGLIALDKTGKFIARTTTAELIWSAMDAKGERFF